MLYFGTLSSLVIIDSVWLFAMGAHYKKTLGSLFDFSVNFIPAIIFYLIYTFGVVMFVLLPAVQKGSTNLSVFLMGALFGLVGYAVYDLTNQATIRNWPLSITLMDMAWGAVLTGLSSLIAYALYAYFK